MQLHARKKNWIKLIIFGKIRLNLSKIWEKLKRNLGRIEAKFGKKLLDLGKILIFLPKTLDLLRLHSGISVGYISRHEKTGWLICY